MGQLPESLSDNIVVDKSRCIFCLECVDKCILDNLRFRASPCRDACPLRMNCQGYVQLIARERTDEALKQVYEAAPFPGILGRVCSAPCESECSRRQVDGQPVAIRALKRFLAGLATTNWDPKTVNEASQYPIEGMVSLPKLTDAHLDSHDSPGTPFAEATWHPVAERPEKVAIIGGGPAGVMAACCLRHEGYQVTLLDAGERLGGMLAEYIPEFRLPRQVVVDEMSIVGRLGVQVLLGRFVDSVALSEMVERYDAVLITTGAGKAKRLGIPGEDLGGVHGGLEFLGSVRSSSPLTVGERVVVVGGGNTAIDAAQTAHRLGAREVRVVCLEARGDMPAFPREILDATEEGIQVENGWGPVRLIGRDGRIAGAELRRCLAVFDEHGEFAPSFSEGDRKTIESDTVIVCIGQEPDLSLLEDSGVEMHRGRVAVDEISLQTSAGKLFAAGDVVTGPRTVVEAMAQGRSAAASIHRYLRRMPMHYGRRDTLASQVPAEVDLEGAVVRPRVDVPRLRGERRRSFAEIEGTMSLPQAAQESERCVSCGIPFGKYRTCWSCLSCEVECSETALRVEVPFLMR